VHRALAIVAVAAAAVGAGCGGASRPDDAPVRALMQLYVSAMVAHDWELACAQLTPEAAQRHVAGTRTLDCPQALAFEAGAPLAGVPHVHPERAGEELTAVLMEMGEVRVDGPLRAFAPLLRLLARWGRRRGADAALVERYVRY
jgi:hypothetical protein